MPETNQRSPAMKKELLNGFNKAYIITEYLPDENWIYNNWMGFLPLNKVKDGANACLEILTETNCPYLLNDNRLVIGAWDKANEWIATDWTPRAVAVGLRYFAHVVTSESFAELSAVAMNEQVNGSFTMQIFHDIDAAKNWLRSKQQPHFQKI